MLLFVECTSTIRWNANRWQNARQLRIEPIDASSVDAVPDANDDADRRRRASMSRSIANQTQHLNLHIFPSNSYQSTTHWQLINADLFLRSAPSIDPFCNRTAELRSAFLAGVHNFLDANRRCVELQSQLDDATNCRR
jgi:hypothetical protein